MTDTLDIDVRALRNDPRERAERRNAAQRKRAARVHVEHFNADTGSRVKRRERRATKKVLESVTTLLERYRDPREVLLEMANTPTAELAKELKCSPLEAHQERRHSALAVLPYLAPKLPVQVDMRHTRAVHVTFEPFEEQASELTIERRQVDHSPSIDLTAEDITDAERVKHGAWRAAPSGVTTSATGTHRKDPSS